MDEAKPNHIMDSTPNMRKSWRTDRLNARVEIDDDLAPVCSARPGTGSKLYYINSWAMCWPLNHPKNPLTG